MERYTTEEAISFITDRSGFDDDGDSDIEEDPQFPLPQFYDEPAELQGAATLSPSPTQSTSHSSSSSALPSASSSGTGLQILLGNIFVSY